MNYKFEEMDYKGPSSPAPPPLPVVVCGATSSSVQEVKASVLVRVIRAM